MPGSKGKSSSDVAGTAKKCQERRKRSNWRTKEVHNIGNGKGVSFIWGGSIIFWGTGLKCRAVHKGCSSCSESKPVVLCHLRWGKKKRVNIQIPLDCFFKMYIELNPARNQNLCHQSQGQVKLQLALHLQLRMIPKFYHLPPPLPPPVSSSSFLFPWCQPFVCQLLCCATILFKVLYCKT